MTSYPHAPHRLARPNLTRRTTTSPAHTAPIPNAYTGAFCQNPSIGMTGRTRGISIWLPLWSRVHGNAIPIETCSRSCGVRTTPIS